MNAKNNKLSSTIYLQNKIKKYFKSSFVTVLIPKFNFELNLETFLIQNKK